MSSAWPIGTSTGPTGLLGRLADDSARVKARVDALSEQSSTGLVSQSFGGLNDGAQISLDLRPQLARVASFTQNISVATTEIDASSQVMEQLQSIASTFFSGTINLAPQTAQEVDSLASQANTALSQVQALLNTKIGDRYIFAGQDTANAPLPDLSFISYVQLIKTVTAGLATAGGTATVAATLAAAATGSPFSSTLGTSRQVMAVGFGVSSKFGVIAGQDSFVTQSGPGTTGSYVKDLIRSLATISALNSSQTALGSNFTTVIDDTRSSLSNQITAINGENAGLGDSSASLKSNQATLQATSLLLARQISSVEDIDAAATVSALTQAQTQLQVSYKLISSMQNMSLIHFL